MGRKRNYKFTNKNFSLISILSAIWGILSLGSLLVAIVLTFFRQGVASMSYGLTAILALILSVAGLVLGIKARQEREKFYLYAYIGIVTNSLTILSLIALVVLGIVFPR